MRRRNDENSVRVTNLSKDIREPELLELFRPFGAVSRVYVAIDQKTGMSRGFGFVNFVNKEDALRAINKLNGYAGDSLAQLGKGCAVLRVCWTCGKKGDHWTSGCPNKDPAVPAETFIDKPADSKTAAATAGPTNGPYVPFGLRAGAERTGTDVRRRNDENFVRVTNLSKDIQEPELLELFRPFGAVSRVYVAIDQKTGMSRGFGFVNFVNKEDALRAINNLNGYAGDSLAQLGKGCAVLRVCRTCGKKGDHWTSRCPNKDPVVPAETFIDKLAASKTAAATAGATKGTYVPSGLRAGVEITGTDMRRRNDENSVRVTNLPEDTREPDLLEVFRPFGAVSDVYVAIDQKTGMSRGFGFVNFVNKEDAQRAINKLNWYGYNSRILRVEWVTPRTN